MNKKLIAILLAVFIIVFAVFLSFWIYIAQIPPEEKIADCEGFTTGPIKVAVGLHFPYNPIIAGKLKEAGMKITVYNDFVGYVYGEVKDIDAVYDIASIREVKRVFCLREPVAL